MGQVNDLLVEPSTSIQNPSMPASSFGKKLKFGFPGAVPPGAKRVLHSKLLLSLCPKVCTDRPGSEQYPVSPQRAVLLKGGVSPTQNWPMGLEFGAMSTGSSKVKLFKPDLYVVPPVSSAEGTSRMAKAYLSCGGG